MVDDNKVRGNKPSLSKIGSQVMCSAHEHFMQTIIIVILNWCMWSAYIFIV